MTAQLPVWSIYIQVLLLKSLNLFLSFFTKSESKEAPRLSPTFAMEPALRASSKNHSTKLSKVFKIFLSSL